MTSRPRPCNEGGPHLPPRPTGPANESRPQRSEGICVNEILLRQAFLRRMGWGQDTFNAAKKAGLRVLTFSKFTCVSGADLLEFLRAQPEIERKSGPGRPDLAERHRRRQAKHDADRDQDGDHVGHDDVRQENQQELGLDDISPHEDLIPKKDAHPG